MNGLGSHIKSIIEKSGPISLATYMDLALQHPEFGYYKHKDPLGSEGDFITAPEISQMFGEMIGLWCADIWQQMGKPSSFLLIECGPGRGTLIEDALRATSKISGFHEALDLYLLESNETLRQKQTEKLSSFKPTYIDDLNELPQKPMLLIANEFLDALPIRQFEKNFQGWCERLITVENDNFLFTLWPLDPILTRLIPANLRDANPGTVYEISPPSLGVVRTLSKQLLRNKGAALLIDYGFIEASGKPTLQAVSKHQFTDVLKDPGEIDITAHVDFGTLKSVAAAEGVIVSGPLGQGEFLNTLGIELRAVQLKQRTTPSEAKNIDLALHRLTNVSEMGSLFKVMSLSSPDLTELAGF